MLSCFAKLQVYIRVRYSRKPIPKQYVDENTFLLPVLYMKQIIASEDYSFEENVLVNCSPTT